MSKVVYPATREELKASFRLIKGDIVVEPSPTPTEAEKQAQATAQRLEQVVADINEHGIAFLVYCAHVLAGPTPDPADSESMMIYTACAESLQTYAWFRDTMEGS